MNRQILSATKYPHPESLSIIQPETDVYVERQADNDLLIRWHADADSILIFVSTKPYEIDLRSSPMTEILGENNKEFKACGLDPEMRHYFGLAFEGGDLHGKHLTAAERIVPLEATINLRDIGGYKTHEGKRIRWGQIFRAGTLSYLTDRDHRYLHGMEIKTVCDLRRAEEVSHAPDRLPEHLKYLHIPIYNQDELPGDLFQFISEGRFEDWWLNFYKDFMVTEKASVFGSVLRELSKPGTLPAVFHCTGGKDRSGVVTMLLLSVLGVPEETIVADYTLSNRYFDIFLNKFEEEYRFLPVSGVKAEEFIPMLVADPQTMHATFDYIRERYGSIETYLSDAAGLDDETIEQLKINLLE